MAGSGYNAPAPTRYAGIQVQTSIARGANPRRLGYAPGQLQPGRLSRLQGGRPEGRGVRQGRPGHHRLHLLGHHHHGDRGRADRCGDPGLGRRQELCVRLQRLERPEHPEHLGALPGRPHARHRRDRPGDLVLPALGARQPRDRLFRPRHRLRRELPARQRGLDAEPQFRGGEADRLRGRRRLHRARRRPVAGDCGLLPEHPHRRAAVARQRPAGHRQPDQRGQLAAEVHASPSASCCRRSSTRSAARRTS